MLTARFSQTEVPGGFRFGWVSDDSAASCVRNKAIFPGGTGFPGELALSGCKVLGETEPHAPSTARRSSIAPAQQAGEFPQPPGTAARRKSPAARLPLPCRSSSCMLRRSRVWEALPQGSRRFLCAALRSESFLRAVGAVAGARHGAVGAAAAAGALPGAPAFVKAPEDGCHHGKERRVMRMVPRLFPIQWSIGQTPFCGMGVSGVPGKRGGKRRGKEDHLLTFPLAVSLVASL